MSAAPSNPSNSSNPATPQPLQTQAQAAKRQRVLACILCQQRKIKCNRKFPCANCVRSGTTCVPATLAPRRKRRTFPEKELLSRLQRYEELMRQNNVKFEPFFKDSPGADNDSPLADDGNGSDEEHPESLTSPEAAAAVGHDKFKAKSFWRLMNHSVCICSSLYEVILANMVLSLEMEMTVIRLRMISETLSSSERGPPWMFATAPPSWVLDRPCWTCLPSTLSLHSSFVFGRFTSKMLIHCSN